MQEFDEQLQASESLASADDHLKLAVEISVAAINRVNIQRTVEQQAQEVSSVMASVSAVAVTLVREAGEGLS